MSGYDRLTHYIPGSCFVGPRHGKAPRIFEFLHFHLAVCNGASEWYSSNAFARECRVILQSVSKRATSIHFLYGENQIWLAAAAHRWMSASIVATFHQPVEQLRHILSAPLWLEGIDRIVVVSRVQMEFFKSLVPAERVFFVPHGVDRAFFKPSGQPPASDKPICIAVGSWLRDFVLLDQVIDRVLASRPDVKFAVVASRDGAKKLRPRPELAVLSGISDSALLELYQSATVHLAPLLDCTANNAVLETMACGVPTVATDVGGIRDYLSDACARLVPAGDASAMADAALELINNLELRQKLAGEACRAAVQFDWEKVSHRLSSIYS